MKNLSDDVAAKVLRQVEFYFSDSNAPRDGFLLDKINAHPEGYVDLAVICGFSRMANLLGLPQKPDNIPAPVIASVAEALAASEALEVSSCKEFVRRRAPLRDPAEVLQEMDQRSVYSGPLPFDCTLEALTDFFATAGPVTCVRMRRHLKSKDFRGSVFVEFESKEVAEKVVKEAKLVYAGAPQNLELKPAYMARKKEEKDAQREAKTAATAETQQEAPEVGSKRAAEEAEDGQPAAKRRQPESSEAGSAHTDALQYQEGVVIGLEFPEDAVEGLHYGAIKAALGSRTAGVVFCDHQMGKATCFVRMTNPESTDALLAKRDGDGNLTLTVNQKQVKAKVRKLEGEEEREFHKRRAEKPSGGNRGGGRGRGNFRGRGRGNRGFGKRGRVV